MHRRDVGGQRLEHPTRPIAMGALIALIFAALPAETKSNKDALEEQIKNDVTQIELLKQAAKKTQLVAQKIQELLPEILGFVGSDPAGGNGRTPSKRRDELAGLLAADLAGAGVNRSAGEIKKVAEAIVKGGQGAMDAAVQVVTLIAESSAGQVPTAPDFPKVTPGDLSNAARLSDAAAADFFSRLLGEQAAQRIAATNKAIDMAEAEIKSLKKQVAELDRDAHTLVPVVSNQTPTPRKP